MRYAVLLVLAGCVSRGPLGPYVRSVSRTGNTLIIENCTIVLEGNEQLRFDTCTTQQIALPPPAVPR
jgi:hypothetical protein